MSTSDGIAITGMAVRLPDAPSLRAFRANLRAGRDSVRPITPERLRTSNLDGEPSDYAELAHLDRIDLFDYEFFGISRREAETMDPHHRISLQLAYAAIEDAGYRVSALRGSRTAVLLAAPSPKYAELVAVQDTLSLLGGSAAALSGRISHVLGSTGTSLVLDTGCSSGLVALHHAAQELLAGRAEYALAGALALNITPVRQETLRSFPEVMSVSGRCRAFDAAADGTSDGEGGAILFLTTLRRAREEGAHIYAVLRATSVRHNGSGSAALATPSVTAQREVITEAWESAGLSPTDAGYVEAHGSGTRLGDEVEIAGLEAARGAAGEVLPIGSVKTNIGHLDQAAGIAGLVKAVLSVRHGELYPSLHFTEPPETVDLVGSRIEVSKATRRWSVHGGLRRAGVSSFSLTGTNTHVVVEEPPTAQRERPTAPRIATVSAKTPTALATYCELLAAHLRREKHPFVDVAHVLNAGRDDYAYRRGVVATDNADLGRQLTAVARTLRTADEAHPSGPVPDGTRLYLLLSGDADEPAPPPTPERLAGIGDSAAARRIEWQAGWYTRLQTVGVRVDGVLTSGTGRLAARIVRGEATVDEASDLLAEPVEPLDQARLKALVDDLREAGPVVFCELGARGELAETIQRHTGDEVLTLPTDPTNADLHAVAALYEWGADVDWETQHRDLDGEPHRVPLPTYPFEEQPCWAARRPPAELGTSATPTEPATGTIEERIRHTLRDALHAWDIDADSNYFALGGNSITALEVVSGIERACGVSLRLLDLYEHPTSAQLAELVSARLASGTGDAPGGQIAAGQALVPSFGQERFWFHHEMESDSRIYNLPSFYRLRGPLDVAALCGAIGDLVARHEVLRSRIPTVDGRPSVVIDDQLPEVLRVVDVSAADDPLAAGTRILNEEAETPFDFAAGPLLRNVLAVIGPDDHLLCMNVHHSVDDGWSPQIVDRELAEFYAARLENRPARLDPLPIQYRDYARWQRDWLQGENLRHELAYWQQNLSGLPQLDLPTDRPRPERKDFGGAFFSFTIPADVVRGLRDIGRQESTTLFTVLLAASSILLARHSGQRDFTIGTATAGRSRPEARDLIGFFNNLMALRMDLSGEPDVPELLRRIRTTVLGALEHDEVPFDKVVETMAPARSLDRHSLFDVVFVHQTIPSMTSRLGDVSWDLFESEDRSAMLNGIAPGTAEFDLGFCVWDREGYDDEDMPAGIEFSTQLFDASTIQAMAQQWVCLLRELAEDYRRPALDLSLGATRDEVLAGPPAEPVAEHETLVGLVMDQVERTPDAVAIESPTGTYTYQQLWQETLRTADRLRAASVGRGDVVAVALPRSPALVTTALAALHVGAAYLPLDPKSPAARLDFQLDDSGARVLVAGHADETDALTWQGTRIHLDAAHPDAAQAGSDDEAPAPTADDVAYVIYTSGSTGTPKGVRIAHRNVVNALRATREPWELRKGARVLQFAPSTFDASVYEVFGGLVSGATLCLPDADTLLVGNDLADYLTAHRIGFAILPPSVLASLPHDDFPDLRVLVSAGEAVPPEMVARFAPGRRMINGYGPSEAAIVTTQGDCVADGRRPSIGAPIAGARLRILDHNGRPVPPGVPGELVIGGAGVGLGYLNRPELTSERFPSDPLGPDGAREYRTGDLVRLRHDGTLEFVGRADHQVKHRGYRIELGEIEAALRACDGVVDAAVVLARNGDGERLLGYVTGCSPDADVRTAVAERVPSYMVPASITVLDAMPLNASGKVDRPALEHQASTVESPASSTAVTEPATELERVVADLFADVLESDRIGRESDFFTLGGHSLLAVQLLRHIQTRTGRRLHLSVLFEAPTVAQLAEKLESDDVEPFRCLVPIRSGGSRPPLFCVHASGGTALSYLPFADVLPADQPVYGLQSYGLDADSTPDRRVSRMVRRYLREIRTVSPDGPYFLAGWSFGGLVAYELARVLRRRGEQVAMVALLDADVTEQPPEHPADDTLMLIDAVEPWLEPGAADELRALGDDAARQEVIQVARRVNLLPREVELEELQRYIDVLRANDEAAASWSPQPLDAPVYLLRPEHGRIGERGLETLGELVSDPVDVRDVPGDHFSIMTTHVGEVARELAACVEQARAAPEHA